MTCSRFHKLAQYFHAADRAAEPARGHPAYDRLFKVRPVIDVIGGTCRDVYHLSREASIDEAMIAFTDLLSIKQYMPKKPIKRGIKVWVMCDTNTALMSRFEFYLGRQNDEREHGLGYNLVMKLSDNIRHTHRFLFFDNVFTSIPLMEHLLMHGLYACGTVCVNRNGYLAALKNPKMVPRRGDFTILQKGQSNLTANVWKDKKPVHLLPTLSDPTIVTKATRRVGADAVDVDQPHCVYDYNRFMSGVDTFDQHRGNYDVGRKGKKAWRYLCWFLLNAAIINAFVLYQATSRRQLRKRRYRHLAFRLELVEQLIGGFSGRKRKANPFDARVLSQRRTPGSTSASTWGQAAEMCIPFKGEERA